MLWSPAAPLHLPDPRELPVAWPWGGGGVLLLALAWLAGTAAQLQCAALWSPGVSAGLLALAGLIGLLGMWCAGGRTAGQVTGPVTEAVTRQRQRAVALGLISLALALGAFWLTQQRAAARLAQVLPAELEGVDLVLVGRVQGLPQIDADGLRFVLALESAHAADLQNRWPLQGQVALAWGAGWQESQRLSDPPAALRSGERWQLPVRLKQPHGLLNPHGFDAELWLFEQGIVAVGAVQGQGLTAPRRLDGPRWNHPLEVLGAWRQRWRDQILLRLGDRPDIAGLVAALVVGDQSAIDADGWDLFRRTGIAHLVAISGMHITLFAYLAAAVVGGVWRTQPRWLLVLPAPRAAGWGGLMLATLYALLAGWGLPAQRTVAMLAATVCLRSLGRRWPAPLTVALAAVAVTALDPWALLQAGFWLSFVAVWLLMASEPSQRAATPVLIHWRARLLAWWRRDLAAQWVATVGLAPLSLLLFQQLSLVGLLANLVAVPLVTFVVTPLALAGVLWPACWVAAGAVLTPLLVGLRWLAEWPWAVWALPVAPLWAQALALAGGTLMMLPVPRLARITGLWLCLPLLWPQVPRPAAGHFEVLAADVGQGSAVLVRTARHSLLHDTGPQVARDSDAGRRVLLPLLQALGERQLDELVLSHRDLDHVGGAPSLLAALPVQRLRSSLAPGHLLRQRVATDIGCAAGQRWDWDGVQFEVLHPPPGAALEGVKPNTVSCVLRVQDAAGHALLITGDLEAEQEAQLVAAHGSGLAAELLLVPHHGSKTSSSPVFLAAVQPQVAVIQAGYRNRYGHPHPSVTDRYRALGIAVVRSDHCGAWIWHEDGATCTRDVRRRYWHWRPPPPTPPGAGAVVANDKPAGDRE